tara:strand:+ start:2729 stop:3334 length:606 start_codon:yes stop_codon:yes gene_type:complete
MGLTKHREPVMPSTISLTSVSALSAAFDGDEGATDRYHNILRGLRNAGAITADVSESGARGGYGPTKAALARLALVAFQASGGREMPIALGRWLAERPVDPSTARAAAGVTWTPPTRGETLVQRTQAGIATTVIAELAHRQAKMGLAWTFRLDEPEPKSEARRAAYMVREATRAAAHDVRASIILPVSELAAPILQAMGAE